MPAPSIWRRRRSTYSRLSSCRRLELDPAPPLFVLLVVNSFRCVKGVWAFDDPAPGDEALFSLDPPRTNRDETDYEGQGYGRQPRKYVIQYP